MSINDLIDKYLSEKKKKKVKIETGPRSELDKKKALRIPTAKSGFTFKDKKKYTRKKKHKQDY